MQFHKKMYEIPDFISDALHGIPYFYQSNDIEVDLKGFEGV